MHYVKQYIAKNKVHKNTYDQLNHVCLYKKIIIPAELVEMRGGQEIKCYYNFNAKSILQWKIKFPSVLKPIAATKRTWDKFKVWLKAQTINTVYDFKSYYSSTIKILECKRYY